MRLGMFFHVALANMAQNKMRTGLTLLGLIIGISSVLLMTGLGRGFQQVNQEMMSGFLPNKLTVRRGYSDGGNSLPLTLRDVNLLQSLIGNAPITAVASTSYLSDLTIRGFDEMSMPSMLGTTSGFAQTNNLTFVQGRFFTAEEEAEDALVIVVNQAFLDAASGSSSGAMNSGMMITSAAGSSVVSPASVVPDGPSLAPSNPEPTSPGGVYINGKRFQVVGVFAEPNSFGWAWPTAYLPINLFPFPLNSPNMQLEQGSPVVDEIAVLATDVPSIAQARRDIEVLLRLAHGLRADQSTDFTVDADGQFVNMMEDSNRIFTLVLGGIGAISLFVGGIGIMNIMLASISERTREIGIRKAVGAKNRDILFQFLIEAIVVCLVGAFLGIAISYLLGDFITKQMTANDPYGIRIVIDQQSVLIATACGAGAGIIFGLYPAIRATRLDPIQALQSE